MLNLPTKKPQNPRVSFTYLKQLQQRSHSQQTPTIYHRSTPQDLRIERQIQTNTKNQHSVSFNLSFQEQTLKKEGWDVQARTERKYVGRRVDKQVPEAINRDQNRIPHNEKIDEVHLLRQEIRYIRKKLLDSENNEKDLRLEFQLFKANQEIETPSTLTARQEQPEQQIMTKNEQLQRIWRDHEQQTKEICQMKQLLKAEKDRVLNLEISLSEAKRQNESLKTNNKDQFILQNLSRQNERLNSLFERQKEARLNAEDELTMQTVEHENAKEQIQLFQKLLESKNKDINFLNQQSYQLDMALQKGLRQIQHLNNQSVQSKEKFHAQLSQHQQIVHGLQADIERLALIIEEQKTKYKQMLQEISKDTLLFNSLKSKLENDTSLSIESAEKYKDVISSYEIELQKLRKENKQYKQTISKMTYNEEVLVNQLTFYREDSVNRDELEEKYRQKEEAWLTELNALRETEESERKKHQVEKQYLQSRLLQFSAKFQDKADKHIKHFNNVINSIQPSTQANSLNLDLYSSQQLLPSPPASQQSIRAQSLTHQEVSQYIQLIKNQPDSNEQHLKLLQDFQDLQQQMAFLKKSLEQTIEDTRQRYEKQLRDSQNKYERHLHRYTQQIEELMQQMSLIKGQASQRGSQVEIIQEDPELQDQCDQQEKNEYDNSRVERDLMLHADDHSSFFANPSGSDTPVKELTRLTTPTSQNQDINYMLQDIMDLESKVHSYIHNFNRRRSSRPEQQKSD